MVSVHFPSDLLLHVATMLPGIAGAVLAAGVELDAAAAVGAPLLFEELPSDISANAGTKRA
jgi:hypothetical protein